MGRDYCHGDGDGDGGISSSSSKSKKKGNGCMAAFYHLFNSHRFYFPSHHHHHHLSLTSHSPSCSKDLKSVPPSTTTYKDKQSFNIPVRLRAVKTNTCTLSCDSPGSNTPNLVARLMGLDLLPNTTDLSKRGTRLGSKSLPASPRTSSSDFDIHRASLQLNKENNRCLRLKEMKQDQKENQSPVRQMVKDRVVGMDLTNSVKKREARPSQNTNELRRDSTFCCSPRARFSDKENRPSTIHITNSSSTTVSKASGEKRLKQRRLRPVNKCNKAESEPSIPLHKNKLKKTAKSNHVYNISATGPPQKVVNETQGLRWHGDASSICSRLKHRIEENDPQVSSSFSITCEKDYITRVMNLAGINPDSPVSSATMLHSWVFCKLENSGENPTGSLALRCNRMLLFDLLNEILIDTMELHAKRRRSYQRSDLIREICFAVASSVSVDVDHLLETKNLENDGEGVIAEIERDIIDALLREMLLDLALNTRRIQTTITRRNGVVT